MLSDSRTAHIASESKKAGRKLQKVGKKPQKSREKTAKSREKTAKSREKTLSLHNHSRVKLQIIGEKR